MSLKIKNIDMIQLAYNKHKEKEQKELIEEYNRIYDQILNHVTAKPDKEFIYPHAISEKLKSWFESNGFKVEIRAERCINGKHETVFSGWDKDYIK